MLQCCLSTNDKNSRGRMRHEVLLKSEPGDRYAKEVIVGGEQRTKNRVLPNRKTVILLGRSRAGKTSLINAFANYLYRVKEDDEFRYTLLPIRRKSVSTCFDSITRRCMHLITASSSTQSSRCLKTSRYYERTKQLSSYVLNNTVLNHPIAFVDTPPIDNGKSGSYSPDWSQYDTFEQIRRWFREGYYCPVEDLEVWLVLPSFDSHMRKIVWHTVNTVMREIECPVVRLVPIISFAENTKPSQALKSLAQVGYDGLIEGENFYTFNSSAILSATDGMTDHNALSFDENYAHMELILNNLQKKFQWMTVHDGSTITTMMQVYLNRDGDDRTRLYATDSFRSGQYITVGDHLEKAKLLTSNSFNRINTKSLDTSNSRKRISNHGTEVHSSIDNDHDDLASVSTEWTKYSMDDERLNLQPITNSTLKENPLNASINSFVHREATGTIAGDSCRLGIETETLDEESGEWYSASDSSAPTVTADLSKYYYESANTSTLNRNPRKLSQTRQSPYCSVTGEPDYNMASDKDANCIGSFKAASMSSILGLQQQPHSITSHNSFDTSNSQQRRQTVTEDNPNQESLAYEHSSTLSSSTTCDYSDNAIGNQKHRKCLRRKTGKEYEIIRVRRRKVKDESTQTSDPQRTRTDGETSFVALQPDSDGSEYFASDLEFQSIPRIASLHETGTKSDSRSFSTVQRNLVQGTLV